MPKLQAVRGMNDILPEQAAIFSHIESTAKRIFAQYGYQQAIFPCVEKTELFEHSVGQATDIVEKEMYTFEDRNGESLTLRPEGTAGCVRAGIEHGLFYNQTQRLWYSGPMFRHERPQKGRYRQFYHIGVEAFGYAGPDIDAEMLFMSYRLFQALGLTNLTLEINTLGSSESREAYRKKLIGFFEQHANKLDEDSTRRLKTNPLRILDSKNPEMQSLIAGAPKLTDYLDKDSKAHYDTLKSYLRQAAIPFVEKPTLVRGLDYYCHTVYEWTTEHLGAQATVLAGGRFDGLVKRLGGQDTPACGFALGVERLSLLLENQVKLPDQADIYIVVQSDDLMEHALILAEKLRARNSRLKVLTNCGGGSMKSQFKKADKSGADVAIILGDEEFKHSEVTIKNLRDDTPQQRISFEEALKITEVRRGKL